jgi:hypothetical protein
MTERPDYNKREDGHVPTCRRSTMSLVDACTNTGRACKASHNCARRHHSHLVRRQVPVRRLLSIMHFVVSDWRKSAHGPACHTRSPCCRQAPPSTSARVSSPHLPAAGAMNALKVKYLPVTPLLPSARAQRRSHRVLSLPPSGSPAPSCSPSHGRSLPGKKGAPVSG